MTKECPFCNALLWKQETSGLCCNSGKVEVSLLPTPPEPLSTLLLGNTGESKNYLENIRKYNSLFQMTSIGCNKIDSRQGWNPCFKVQGHVYHRIGSLCPPDGEKPKFAQIYFLGDDKEEQQIRNGIIPGLIHNSVTSLQTMLHKTHTYVESLMQNTPKNFSPTQLLHTTSSSMLTKGHLGNIAEGITCRNPVKLPS